MPVISEKAGVVVTVRPPGSGVQEDPEGLKFDIVGPQRGRRAAADKDPAAGAILAILRPFYD